MTVIASTLDIAAPAERVWEILIDLAGYETWNPFTPRIDATLRVGDPVVLTVAMRPGRTLIQREVCTAYDPDAFVLGWGMTLGIPLLLRADRLQRLTPLPGGGTRYHTEDAFSGLLAPLVLRLYGADIQRGFDAVARALAAKAEERAKEVPSEDR